jgi:hypothetical protein
MPRQGNPLGIRHEPGGGICLSNERHLRRQARGVNAQIHNRMYDDRHNERAGNNDQHFRVKSYLVSPHFGGVIAEGGNSKISESVIVHLF